MLFWNKICGLITIFFLCTLFSSAQVSYYSRSTGINVSKKLVYPPLFFLKKSSDKELNINKPLSVIPQNYYTQHFGVICKKELAIEKTIKIPFRFRLGSVQQCNYLEAKR
jgi:hypothetical protein